MTRSTLLFALVLGFGLAAPAVRAEEVMLVLMKGASALALYSMEGQELARIPVGQHPHEMLVSPDGRYVYTTDNGAMNMNQAGPGGNTVSIVDLKERRRIGVIDLGEYRRPHGIARDAKTGYLLVTTEAPDRLLVLDPVKRGVVRALETQGRTSHMVVAHPSSRWAFVANSNSLNVSAVNLDSGKVKLIPTGEHPEGSAFSHDGQHVFIANRDAGTITIIDVKDLRPVATFKSGSSGVLRIEPTPDDRTLVYISPTARRVETADVATRSAAPVALALLPGEPVSLWLSPDGKLAYAGVEKNDTVYVISLPERHIVREIKTPQGSGPDPVQVVRLP